MAVELDYEEALQVAGNLSMHPAYLSSSVMKEGRDFERRNRVIIIPLEYLERRLEALKTCYNKTKEIMPNEMKFKESHIVILS